MNLENAVVVITGASRGLGQALAEAFAKERSRLVLGARNQQELQEVARPIKAIYAVMDVTLPEDVQRFADYALREYGCIDLWVNNAGITLPHAPFSEIDWKNSHRVMEVNFFGLAYGCHSAAKAMVSRKSGVIVNILSMGVLTPRPQTNAYYASKSAAAGLTRDLRQELKPSGVKVFGVYPGGIKTHLFDESGHPAYDTFMEASYVAQQVVDNLKREEPEEDLIIKKPGT